MRRPGLADNRRLALAPLAAGLALLALSGCRKDMHEQPKYKTYAPSDLFPDGASARPVLEGTVARDDLRTDRHRFEGIVDGKLAETFPFPVDRAVLERGRERYQIFCTPCHGELGDGAGMIVQRGFSPPPPFYGKLPKAGQTPVAIYDDLTKAPVGHFFDVITNGHGAMYSYAARIPVDDRWAITAYIRALQLSRHASVADLEAIEAPNDEERRLLQEAGR